MAPTDYEPSTLKTVDLSSEAKVPDELVRLEASKARQGFRDLLDAAADGLRVMITRNGKPIAAMVSLLDLEKLETADRAADARMMARRDEEGDNSKVQVVDSPTDAERQSHRLAAMAQTKVVTVDIAYPAWQAAEQTGERDMLDNSLRDVLAQFAGDARMEAFLRALLAGVRQKSGAAQAPTEEPSVELTETPA